MLAGKNLSGNSTRRSQTNNSALGAFTMEHLETQASDLRYLAQGPVPMSDAGSVSYDTPRPGQHGSPRSASYGDNSAPAADSSNSKRKSTDDAAASGKQTRSKRNRVRCLICASDGAGAGVAGFPLWHRIARQKKREH